MQTSVLILLAKRFKERANAPIHKELQEVANSAGAISSSEGRTKSRNRRNSLARGMMNEWWSEEALWTAGGVKHKIWSASHVQPEQTPPWVSCTAISSLDLGKQTV